MPLPVFVEAGFMCSIIFISIPVKSETYCFTACCKSELFKALLSKILA